MISVATLAPYLEKKIASMSQAEQFRFFILLMQGAQYKLRRENVFETDCSGTICWPLFCMDFNIRMTAAQLFSQLFIRHVSLGDIRDYWDHVFAVFYEKDGMVSHVSPIVGRGVIFDAVNPEQPAQLKDLPPVVNWYIKEGFSLYFREINWAAADKIAQSPENSWDAEADDLLKELWNG